MKRFLILLFLSLFLLLLQTSFLPYFALAGFTLPLFILALIVMSIMEEPGEIGAAIFALLGGTMMDLFSSFTFGFWLLSSLLIVVACKVVIKSHARLPFFQER